MEAAKVGPEIIRSPDLLAVIRPRGSNRNQIPLLTVVTLVPLLVDPNPDTATQEETVGSPLLLLPDLLREEDLRNPNIGNLTEQPLVNQIDPLSSLHGSERKTSVKALGNHNISFEIALSDPQWLSAAEWDIIPV